MEIKMRTAVAYGQSKEAGIYALASVVNALAAEGIKTPVVQVRILIPEYAFKSRMHTMEKMMKQVCQERKITLQDVQCERNNVISQTMVVATGSGLAEKKKPEVKGTDVVLTGWIGMEGMLRILSEKEKELKTRFSTGFLKQIESHKTEIFAETEIAFAKEQGGTLIRQVGEGGIFAALWNLAKEMERGIEVDLKKIPVLQETIEVCEFFRLNPYQLTSAGTMLIVAEDGEKLTDQLNQQGISAAVIGTLTDSNDKILKNGEEVRYIDRPAPDEIMKIFET